MLGLSPFLLWQYKEGHIMAGGAVLSAFMQVLFERLSTTALREFRSVRGIKNELENLSSTLSTIQVLLEDAEEKQFKDKCVRDWLAKLKDVAYDLDDLLDDHAAEALRSQLEGNQSQSRWKRQVCHFMSCTFWQKSLFHRMMAHRIRRVQEKLARIAEERDILGLQALGGMGILEITERPETSSLVDGLNVFGREEDRDNIVNILLSINESSPQNVSVLPIVGMGGLGKTTVAQLVYNDERIKKHFQLRMWVCVSENFDERKLTKETLDSAINGYSSTTTNMNILQQNLFEHLKGKRFLLVLDDVWNEDHNKWHRFSASLNSGEKGSKIVVTTQNENVGRIMGGFHSYRLQRLSENNCWSLFKNCAFVDGNSSGYPRLEEIGKKIVERLKGLPLAARAVGCLLYSKLDEEEWKDILRSEIWELTPDTNSILPALRLGYKHLPPHLKQCFAFCAVFHKDYVFERDNLVQIWMALGFIQPQGVKRLEDIGNTYFDDLLSRSFFQPYKGNYVMHDAIHDLAQHITMDDCHRLEDYQRLNNCNKIRHLSFSCDNSMLTSFEAFYSFKRLRTILLLRGYKSNITSVPDDLFVKLRCLRVLDLYRRGIKELPQSIGNLKQLRYLGLSGTKIKTLPSSVGKLYNLQTLKLKNCNTLQELPEGIINLINLRHLEANTRLIANISGIGRLTCLQKLEEFVVQKDEGRRIMELKDMMQLRGRLCIAGLENVASREESNEAQLNTKEHLSLLEFAWKDNRDIGLHQECLDEIVLEGLRPHRELKEMKITGYAGASFPSWLASPLSSLQTIHLSNCMRCRCLPPLGQLPFLEKLEIIGADEVIQISQEFSGNGATKGFPSLNELVLDGMPNLEEWLLADGDQLFPCLTELDVIDCPKLKALPCLPSTLTRLRISEAGLGVLPELWDSNQPSSLSSLHVENCPNLTSLQKGLLSHPLGALKDLKINTCEGLRSLPSECFRHFTSLESLHICKCPSLMPSTALEEALLPSSLEDVRIGSCYQLINPLLNELRNLAFLAHLEIANCPDLYYFPLEDLPNTLKFLAILDCTNLQHLPPHLWKLSSLDTLIIGNCPRIPHLPSEGLPKSLHELYIKACPSLKERCERDREDWAKVAHIAKVEIDEDIMSE